MEIHRGFVEDLAIVFCVAAITTVVCRKLRQPVVLGYLLAGMIVGPYIPIPLVADLDTVHTLSELGVILVMFAIGLEFNFRKLIRMAPTSGIIALIQIAFMIWLGYLTGVLFGWTTQESLFTGAMIAISSTMIIAKAFSEYSASQRVRDLVLGVLIFEDIVAVLLLAMLTAFASTGAAAVNSVLPTATLQLLAFLLVMVIAGFFIVPRFVRAIVRLDSPETLLIASIGICFGMAYLAEKVGYSVALGSFVAGALVAESGEAARIEHLVQSVRDVFAAIFFISVGMLMNPALLLQYWHAVLVLTFVVVFGKMISVTLGALLTGNDVRTSVQSGMSMAQIGEFSFIIISAGLASRVIGDFLYPVAITVAIITTFTTPWLISQSGKAAFWVDNKLPESIRTSLTLYDSWIQRVRKLQPTQSRYKKLALFLLLDTISVIIIIIATAVGFEAIAGLVKKLTDLNEPINRWIVIGLAGLAAIPFLIGMTRSARAHAVVLAEYAMPSAGSSKVDLAEAPRNLMVVTLEYGTVLVLAIVILAVTQPFLPPIPAAVFILLLLILVGIVILQRASDLQGHLRAGGQIILAALAKQSKSEQQKTASPPLEELLPGLGTVYPVALDASHASVGKSLGELNLHSLTGASVIAISRGSEGIVAPSGKERLLEGDVLTLIGTEEAVQAAKELLTERKGSSGST